jgi:hypothetical protein
MQQINAVVASYDFVAVSSVKRVWKRENTIGPIDPSDVSWVNAPSVGSIVANTFYSDAL